MYFYNIIQLLIFLNPPPHKIIENTPLIELYIALAKIPIDFNNDIYMKGMNPKKHKSLVFQLCDN